MVAEMCIKLKEAGYAPTTFAVLLNVEEEEKESALVRNWPWHLAS